MSELSNNNVLSYPTMTRQRADKIQAKEIAYAEDVNAEFDHIVDVYNRLVALLTGEWGDGTGRIYDLVDNAVSLANEALAKANNCVQKSGDTMTGHLSISLVPSSDYHVVNKKYVDDTIQAELADPVNRIGELENFRDNLNASQVKLENANFSSTNVNDGMNELFISVSNGKKTVADAITGKGVETSGDASFKQMADNINAILTFNEGTAGGTATAADIMQGKTAYARGSLIVGTFKVDLSDATATPYDILQGKSAYVGNGKIDGVLTIDETTGKPSYNIGDVEKVYGSVNDSINRVTYSDLKESGTTSYASTIACNKRTGLPVAKFEIFYNDTDKKYYINTYVIDNINENYNLYNKKTIDIDVLLQNRGVKLITCGDFSDENNLYIHIVSNAGKLVILKINSKKIELENGAYKYYYDVDLEKSCVSDFSVSTGYSNNIAVASDNKHGAIINMKGTIVIYELKEIISDDNVLISLNRIDIKTNMFNIGTTNNTQYCSYMSFCHFMNNDKLLYYADVNYKSFIIVLNNFQIIKANELSYPSEGRMIISDNGNYGITAKSMYNIGIDYETGDISVNKKGELNTTLDNNSSLYIMSGDNLLVAIRFIGEGTNSGKHFLVDSYKIDWQNNNIELIKSIQTLTNVYHALENGMNNYETPSKDLLYMTSIITGSSPYSENSNIFYIAKNYSEVIALLYEGEYYYKQNLNLLTATSSDVLQGKTYIGKSGKMETGTMGGCNK